MTREELEKRMDEPARKYVKTRDPEIREELYKLRVELKRLEKEDWLLCFFSIVPIAKR
jgi:hypothetical protein